MNCRQDAHAPSEIGTLQNVHGEDTEHQFGPRESARSSRWAMTEKSWRFRWRFYSVGGVSCGVPAQPAPDDDLFA